MLAKILMIGSAGAFALIGIAALFLPGEIAGKLMLPRKAELTIQLMSAGLLAMATLNYIGRNASYGGIYGKPIMLANFMFGMISCNALISAQLTYHFDWLIWLMILMLALYTIGFAKLIFFPAQLESRQDTP